MREFLFTLVCAGVASGIICLLFEDDKELIKYIKVVISLCVAASLVPSATNLLGKIKTDINVDIPFEENVTDYGEKYREYVIENARIKLCAELERNIFEKTGIKVNGCDIQFSVEKTQDKIYVDVKGVTVTLDETQNRDAVSQTTYAALGVHPKFLP